MLKIAPRWKRLFLVVVMWGLSQDEYAARRALRTLPELPAGLNILWARAFTTVTRYASVHDEEVA